MNRELSALREIYNELMSDKSKIDQILKEGAERVRPIAQKNLEKVKKAVGVLR